MPLRRGRPIDGLVINCLDHLADVSPKICVGYRLPPDMEIERLPVSPVPWLAAQERLAMLLERVEPVYRQISLTAVTETLARRWPRSPSPVLVLHGKTGLCAGCGSDVG